MKHSRSIIPLSSWTLPKEELDESSTCKGRHRCHPRPSALCLLNVHSTGDPVDVRDVAGDRTWLRGGRPRRHHYRVTYLAVHEPTGHAGHAHHRLPGGVQEPEQRSTRPDLDRTAV